MRASRRQALILVVEDEPEVLDNVATVLDAAGYSCHCCATAEAAVALARSKAPDLILSDISLSGTSGLELCERIKEDPTLAHVPVMFLSGAQIPDIIRRSHAVGGAYYLRKPFDPEVLVELVDTALGFPRLVTDQAACNQPMPAGA